MKVRYEYGENYNEQHRRINTYKYHYPKQYRKNSMRCPKSVRGKNIQVLQQWANKASGHHWIHDMLHEQQHTPRKDARGADECTYERGNKTQERRKGLTTTCWYGKDHGITMNGQRSILRLRKGTNNDTTTTRRKGKATHHRGKSLVSEEQAWFPQTEAYNTNRPDMIETWITIGHRANRRRSYPDRHKTSHNTYRARHGLKIKSCAYRHVE